MTWYDESDVATYLAPGELIASLPDNRPDTLFVVAFPPDRADRVATSTPAMVTFHAREVETTTTQTMITRVAAGLPYGNEADLLLVVVGHDDEPHRLPHRATIAALDAALHTAGHIVLGHYWTPHTRPGASWRDYRRPASTDVVVPARAPADFSQPVHITTDELLAPWDVPFAGDGETVPARLSRFTRSVLSFLARRDDRAHVLVRDAIARAARGEFPDDKTGFAVAAALGNDAVYAAFLLPAYGLDPQRVEQLWLALHRGNTDRRIRAKLATLVAASALQRGDHEAAAHAHAHAEDAPGAASVGVLIQPHLIGFSPSRQLNLIAAQIAARLS